MSKQPATNRSARIPKIHIYKITQGDSERLVRALSRSKAIKHCIMVIEASIATQDELVELLSRQVQVEEVEG